ncbi:type-F conjugative transfer system protein TrbI [Pantoea cypripedii]|uniref:Type-F conjugative transfer system protein TrbI n=1 Tax=Pantoea cypripedii TaxID=55209 RepID=A0A1X1EMS3_PANCY|nr:type-F conjugative transfer system protein TrbI [Pantoea cypripedii]MBP2200578.1 conjugal transfer pilin signal peptidase TrbI [Pantoea cypripedii]ORM90074.1 type-F conjugative transfer system protein TrbI [Pantoea cypripedii]
MQEEKHPPAGPDSETADDSTLRDAIGKKSEVSTGRGRVARIAALTTVVIVLSAGISALVARAMQPAYVVFDMKGTLDTFRQQTAQTPLTQDAQAALTTRFGTALNASLTGWQAEHGGVILVKGAVVSGAPDITPEIQADIARQMQGAP